MQLSELSFQIRSETAAAIAEFVKIIHDLLKLNNRRVYGNKLNNWALSEKSTRAFLEMFKAKEVLQKVKEDTI